MMMAFENYDPCFPDQPVVHRYLPVWARLPAFRSKPAFIWAEDGPQRASITYSELSSSVEAMASKLLLSLRRGDSLLVLCSPGLELVKLLFACQRAGIVGVPVIPPDPSSFSPPHQGPAHHHLLRAISQTRPTAAVAHRRYISAARRSASGDRLAELLHRLRWLYVDDLDDDAHHAWEFDNVGCAMEDTYLIQYTSGASGVPKPVVVTAGAAAHNARAARRAYDLHPGSVVVSWLPQYHDCGLMFLLLTVVAGATCVLAAPTAFLRRPRLWLELVTEFRATCTPVPSFALPLVLRRGGGGALPLSLGSLRNLVLINEPIYKAAVEEFVAEFSRAGLQPSSISPSYGLAENCTFVSTAWHCAGGDMPSYKKLLPSARLSSDGGDEIEIAVVDEETFEPVEDGVEGEVWVSSPSNASGYLSHPSLTREVFDKRLQGTVSRRFVRTGDRGVVRGDERYLYIVGRSSDIIKVGEGFVHPHYVETAAYESSPERLRGGCIAVFGVELWKGMEISMAVVVVVAELLRNGKSVGVDDGGCRSVCKGIREAVLKKEGVAVGMVVLVESGSVPKTTSGKLRRWAVKHELLAGRLPVVFEVRFDEASVANEKISNGVGYEGEVGSEVSISSSSAGRRSSLHSLL